MTEQEYTPTEARLRERVKGSLGEYAHEFGIDGEAAMDEWIDQALAERDNRVRAEERAKRPDREQYVSEAHRRYPGSGNHPGGERHAFLAGVDAVLSSLALEPEAREDAEYFHDQDGDLWKFTDKGEWFYEEEPGEFRQVLSIDAEDQTLTPVGHAEPAPTPEVTDAEVEAAWASLSRSSHRWPDISDMRAALRAAREVE